MNKNVLPPALAISRDPVSLAAWREVMGNMVESLHNYSTIVTLELSPHLRCPSTLLSL